MHGKRKIVLGTYQYRYIWFLYSFMFILFWRANLQITIKYIKLNKCLP